MNLQGSLLMIRKISKGHALSQYYWTLLSRQTLIIMLIVLALSSLGNKSIASANRLGSSYSFCRHSSGASSSVFSQWNEKPITSLSPEAIVKENHQSMESSPLAGGKIASKNKHRLGILGYWTRKRQHNANSDHSSRHSSYPHRNSSKNIVGSHTNATTFDHSSVSTKHITVTKVITDIDDTVISSGGLKLFGIKLGGIDNRYRRGQVYPGVIQFALELCRSDSSSSPSTSSPPSSTPSDKSSVMTENLSKSLPDRVAVLTARAAEFKFALALKSSGKLWKAYDKVAEMNGLLDWGIGDVYYGSVAEWILHHRKGLRKFKNFEIMLKNDDGGHHHKLPHHHETMKSRGSKLINSLRATSKKFLSGSMNAADTTTIADKDTTTRSADDLLSISKPNRQYILIGDTGEKDEEAGELMATHYPSRVKAIFMHSVHALKPKRGQSLHEIPIIVPDDRKVNGVPIFYFRTYVGAAVKAYQNEMISKDGVLRVAETAVKELELIDKSLKKQSLYNRLRRKRIEELQGLRWKELKVDLQAVESLKESPRNEVMDNNHHPYRKDH